jgi:sugar phosphate isomerase/epimerase
MPSHCLGFPGCAWPIAPEQQGRSGPGDFDFPALFAALETRRYTGHYVNACGSLDEMLRARAQFAGMTEA